MKSLLLIVFEENAFLNFVRSFFYSIPQIFCSEPSLWSLLNSFCLAFPFSGSCVPMNYNEEGKNKRERAREGRPRPAPGRQREKNHPGPRLEISTRTVSECQPSGTDKSFFNKLMLNRDNLFSDYHSWSGGWDSGQFWERGSDREQGDSQTAATTAPQFLEEFESG